jgi:general secretion pathway protein F
MPMFTYAALDGTGRETTGTINAASPADAAEQLSRRGLLPVRTTLASASELTPSAQPTSGMLRPTDMLIFTRQLATLVDAALPLDQALRLVAAQNAKNAVGPFAASVADSVTAGRALSDAISAHAPSVPAFMPALIKAGEARGAPGPALLDLARIQERRIAITARIRGALLYPAVLIGVALLAVSIVLGVLVPTLLPLFQDAGRDAPAALRFADTISRGMMAYWPIILGVCVLAVIATRALLRREGVRASLNRLTLKLPLFGPLMADTHTALIARTLGTLLHNGVPLVDALRVTTSVTSNALFRTALTDATASVQEGTSLSRALARNGAFPDLALRFIAIGEDASRLDSMLLHLADATDAEATRRLDGALSLLSPALTILIGLMIGGLILSVMQAILSVNDLAVR